MNTQPRTLEELHTRAHKLKKWCEEDETALKLSHDQALDIVAKDAGYRSYQHARKELENQ